MSISGLDWSPKTTANFDDKSNEAFLNSLQLYERSSVNDMAKCGNLKVAVCQSIFPFPPVINVNWEANVVEGG